MDSFFYFSLNVIKNFPYSNNFLNFSSVKVSYWTKAEKALDEGNEDKYRKYRDKFKRIQLLTIRKG